MVGVAFAHLEDVDIFNLLGLDPYDLRKRSNESILREIRRAYRSVMLIAHPDKVKDGPGIAQQLNILKDFLYDFDACHAGVPPRVTKLVERGFPGWVSTWNPWLPREDPGFQKSIPAYSRRFQRKTPTSPRRRRTASRPGSSPSNPIVLDCCTRSGALSPNPSPHRQSTASRPGSSPSYGSSPSNPIVLYCCTRSGAPSPETPRSSSPR